MQIIALINQKGGVGKTTCAINIGKGKLNKRVLLIDLKSHLNILILTNTNHFF
jgi:cellulose biosynthesis protein BcsQ